MLTTPLIIQKIQINCNFLCSNFSKTITIILKLKKKSVEIFSIYCGILFIYSTIDNKNNFQNRFQAYKMYKRIYKI